MAGLLELVQGSAHDLSFLADGSVHAVITSPPYFGLRSYAGDQDIDWPAVSYAPMAGLPPVTVPAVRCALGAEADPFAYVGHLILCLREWWRVLRGDGVCLVNLGDSYAANRGYQVPDGKWIDVGNSAGMKAARLGLKPKDLIMIPPRFALAAQADGWYLRAGIVWAKGVSFLADYAGSSMPESVKDRPARSHEDIYLLAKRERYFWDYVAVREEAVRGVVWTGKQGTFEPRKKDEPDRPGQSAGVHREGRDRRVESGRNLRSVWVINPRPFSAAHFACWPETLVDPMIRAATSERGVCPACGAPWVRVVDSVFIPQDDVRDPAKLAKGSNKGMDASNGWGDTPRGTTHAGTIAWVSSCACGAHVGARPDDFEIIWSPTGTRAGDDPSLVTGRAGMNRPRGENEGRRPITRYEQRCYADQIKASPYRALMEAGAGSAFAHYLAYAKTTARPIPCDLLDQWIGQGWLTRVSVPEWVAPDPVPATVLDPFSGSATTGKVCARLGRRYIGVDLASEYLGAVTDARMGDGVQMELV